MRPIQSENRLGRAHPLSGSRYRILGALLWLSAAVFPGPAGAADAYQRADTYASALLIDTRDALSAPLRWTPREWTTAGAITGAAVLVYTQDQKIQAWAQDHRTRGSAAVSDAVSVLGDGTYPVAALGALYLYGRCAQHPRAERTALLGIESIAVSGLVTGAIKVAAGRHRPSTGDGPDSWSGPVGLGDNEYMSFPSGHATTAFALAATLATEYREIPTVPPVAYSLASLAALSRVHDNAHWASDIVIGAAIGYYTGKMVCARHGTYAERVVLVVPAGTGARVLYRF